MRSSLWKRVWIPAALTLLTLSCQQATPRHQAPGAVGPDAQPAHATLDVGVLPVPLTAATAFTNGDFEAGTLNGWPLTVRQNGDGDSSGIPDFPPQVLADLGLQTGGVARTFVVSSATSGYPIPPGLTAADSLRYPFVGNYAALLNRQGKDANVNYLTQSATVSASDVDPADGRIHIRFAVAPVLENPTHDAHQQPYFFVELRNTTKSTVLFSTFNFANQPGVAWKQAAANGDILYTDWQVFDIAPGPAGIAIGDTLSMTLVAAGCARGGHWGQLYVDQFGTTLPAPTVNVSAPAVANAGSPLTYTVLAKNGGSTAATGVVVDFEMPYLADSANTVSWLQTAFRSLSAPGVTCTAPAVGASGTVACNLGMLSAGGSYAFTVTVDVPAVPGGWTAPVNVNAGTYDIKSDQTNPVQGGLVQTQIVTTTPVDLQTTLSDGVASVVWGSSNVYTLEVLNNGPVPVSNVAITDSRPSQLTGATWTCAGTGGGTCGAASGSGNINTTADLPVGAKVTYRVTTTATGSGTGSFTYTATATPPSGFVQAVPFHNLGTDTNSAASSLVTLSVTKDVAGTGVGTVLTSPAAISCGAACTSSTAQFTSGTYVSISAIAPPGGTFVGWSGACTGTTNPCDLTLTANTNLTARFDAPRVSGSIATTSNGGATSVRPGDTVDYQVQLTVPYGNNSGIDISDTFPSGLSYVSATAPTTTGSLTCSVSGGCGTPSVSTGATTTWSFGLVGCTTPTGCQISYTVKARVQNSVTRGATLANMIGGTGINSATLPTVTVIEPGLSITRSAAPSGGLTSGSESTVTVTLANQSGGADAPAFDAVVTLPTPAGTTASGYAAGSCPSALASYASGNATFTFPTGTATLAPGATCSFTYLLTVASGATPGAAINAAAGSLSARSITGAAPPAKSYTVEDTGFALAVATLANGIGCGEAAECTSAVCDTDNKCGYPNGGGACTAGDAAALCRTGVCDADGKCGVALGNGPCTSSTQCRDGLCISAGPNAGQCERCASDADCSGGTAVCNLVTNQCVQCVADNAAACAGATPVCDAQASNCAACNGDYGTAVTRPCPRSTSPYCSPTGACGKCTGDTDCTAGATHLGSVCELEAGSCGLLCDVDTDCPAGNWCDNPSGMLNGGVCVPKLPNGQPVPDHSPIDSTCTDAVAARVCVSGACDASDDQCGQPNGRSCASAAVCRSGVCNPDGKCGEPNGTGCSSATVCRSAVCEDDGKCGSLNGERCANPATCRFGFCVAADGICGLLNGSPCGDAHDCRSDRCFTDMRCGLPNGEDCSSGVLCRSGSCVAGKCASRCTNDAECSEADYCSDGSCVERLENAKACERAAQCRSNVCNGDGKCGDPDGVACKAASTCRSGACTDGKCGARCARDTDCSDGNYCDANKCVSAHPNGDKCARAAQCDAKTCAPDGKCGALVGMACAKPSVCRTGICNGAGACSDRCDLDSECAAGTWCNAATHTCLPAATNGNKPNDEACGRGQQCIAGVCGADGMCGSVNGDPCGSRTPCRSAVCDNENSTCGYLNTHGPCSADNAATVCQSGVCDTDLLCGFVDGNGPCDTNAQCRGAVCNADAKSCGACSDDAQCEGGTYCDLDSGACRSKLPNGEPCSRPSVCVSDVCFDDGQCGKPDGEACSEAAVCRSDRCTAEACGEAASPMDASVNRGKLRVQGGGLLGCSTLPGYGGGGFVALVGFVTAAAALRRRRRRDAS